MSEKGFFSGLEHLRAGNLVGLALGIFAVGLGVRFLGDSFKSSKGKEAKEAKK